MVVVLAVAAAAALIVIAYHRLRQVAPETGAAGLRAVRDLADVVLVCVKAVEGVLDVLARPARLTASTPNRWSYTTTHDSPWASRDDDDFDPDDEQL